MNEKTVIRSSVYVFICGCLVFALLSILLKDISYLVGFGLGYIINILVFLLIIQTSTEILRSKISIPLVILMYVLKFILYSLGFYLSVRLDLVNMIGVFLGYFVMKITIFLQTYKHKGR